MSLDHNWIQSDSCKDEHVLHNKTEYEMDIKVN